MIFYLCILLSIIIFANALLHLLLFFGAPLGEYVLGGKNKIIPRKLRYINFILFFIFSFAGIVYLQYGNIIQTFMNIKIIFFIILFFTIFFGYGIIGNLKFTSSKKEMYVMTPVSIVSFVLSIILIFLNYI